MKRIRKHRKRHITKWAVSYLIILLIPLATICINYLYSMRIVGEEIYQSNELIVDNLGSGVDECLKSVYTLHSYLYYEDTLKNVRTHEEKDSQFYYDALMMKERINTYNSHNTQLSCMIYLPELEYVFDIKSGNEARSYYNTYRMNVPEICGYEEWIEMLSGEYRGQFLVGRYLNHNTGEPCIVYANSMRGKQYQPVNIFVSIPISEISQLTGELYEDAHFMMLINNDIEMAWNNEGPVLDNKQLKKAYEVATEKGSQGGYYVVKKSSDFDKRVSYCMLISRKAYEQKPRDMRNIFCISLAIALLVAFKVLHTLLKQMNEKKLLHERLMTQEEVMQSNYLLMAMKGRKVEEDKNVIQTSEGQSFVLIGIMVPMPDKTESEQDEVLLFTVDNIFAELMKENKYYKIDDGRQLFYLFAVEEERTWREECLKKADYLNQIMKAWWKQGLYIAISRPEKDLARIRVQYSDIVEEFQDRKLLGEGAVTDISKKKRNLSTNQRIVEEIRRLIEERYEDSNLNVSVLAAELGKTPKHISEVFKEETGESILYAINYKRISKAKALMRTGQYKLAEIVEMTGYSNMNTFRRNFQQIMGVAPGKYMDKKEE